MSHYVCTKCGWSDAVRVTHHTCPYEPLLIHSEVEYQELSQKLDKATAEAKKNYDLYCDTIFQRDRAREELEKARNPLVTLEGDTTKDFARVIEERDYYKSQIDGLKRDISGRSAISLGLQHENESLVLQLGEAREALKAIYDCCEDRQEPIRISLHGIAKRGLKMSGGIEKRACPTCGFWNCEGSCVAAKGAENRDDAPERETWMVTRACQEHKRLGSDYEFRPFWGPPVTPCRDCKYEKVLEAHRFGGVAEKRLCAAHNDPKCPYCQA